MMKSLFHTMSVTINIIAVLGFFFLIGILVNIAMTDPEEIVQDIHADVAADTERQYYEVETHGTAIDRCVRAGLVAESYLQAGSSSAYSYWMDVRERDCNEAGMLY